MAELAIDRLGLRFGGLTILGQAVAERVVYFI